MEIKQNKQKIVARKKYQVNFPGGNGNRPTMQISQNFYYSPLYDQHAG